jgi:hypothetical protein
MGVKACLLFKFDPQTKIAAKLKRISVTQYGTIKYICVASKFTSEKLGAKSNVQ